jgi:5-methylcytosine-specific restriction protein A
MNDFKSEVDKQLAEVCKLLELPVSRVWGSKNSEHDFMLRLTELPSPIGIQIHVSDNLLLWRFETSLDPYARPTVALSKEVFEINRDAILGFCEHAKSNSREFSFNVNNSSLRDLEPEEPWEEFKIVMTRPYENLEYSMIALRQGLIDLLTLINSLTRSTDSDPELDFKDGDFREEGELTLDMCRKYERSRFNRDLCLSYYGYNCKVCGISMKDIYGEPGSKVVHVHHIVPVSLMEGPKVLNPIKDLVPLCPNCHNVAHRKNPPYSVDELKNFLSQNA